MKISRFLCCLSVAFLSHGYAAPAQMTAKMANEYCEGVAAAGFAVIASYLRVYKSPEDYRAIRSMAISESLKMKSLSETGRLAASGYVGDYSDDHFKQLTEYFSKSGKSQKELLGQFMDENNMFMLQKYQQCMKEVRPASSVQ